MKEEAILHKLLEKAVAGGFEITAGLSVFSKKNPVDAFVDQFSKIDDSDERQAVLRALLLSHSFAKAFFGEDTWKDELQKAVLEEITMAYYVNLVSYE